MRMDMLDKVRIADVQGKHLLIALSGGADSVALACLLAEKQQEYGLRLTAAHYNHHIRGGDADGDAAYCRQLCRELGIDLIEGEGDVPAAARSMGLGLESTAREMRYRFLYKAMEDCGADLIVLAHHLDDQAETVLMHLLRGTGPEGITGMEILSGRLFRPLLGIRKQALEKFLREKGICWREDATNTVPDTPRNALRLNVLPEIEKSYPSAAEAIGRYASLARAESDFLARLAEKFIQERVRSGPWGYRISLEGDAEEVLLRRAIRKLCPEVPGFHKMEEIILLCGQPRGKTEISDALYAEKTPSALYLLRKNVKKPEPVSLIVPGRMRFGENGMILAEPAPAEARRNTMNEEILDADAIAGACIRSRMDGDRIRPLGMGGDRLLSDYFTDKKIDRPLRDHLPLLAVGKRILWVGGTGISEDAKIRPETRKAVRLTYITDEKAEV